MIGMSAKDPTTRISFGVLVTAAMMTITASHLLSCGQITLGGAVGNDAEPSGRIVAQGTLVGQNGRSVSGTAVVYRTTCSTAYCDFVVRLQNLNTPTDATLLLIPVVNGAATLAPSSYTLRSYSGTSNYSFSQGTTTMSWSQIIIRPSSAGDNTGFDYGVATLTAVASQ